MQPNRAGRSEPRNAKWLSYFVKLPYAVIAHPNYLTLSPKTQQILIDIHRQIQRYTNFGIDPLPENGFPYCYGHCIVDTHRNTFARAMKTLIERRWIRETFDLDNDPEVRHYEPLGNWRQWEPTDKQRDNLRELRERIERRELADHSTTCTILVQQGAPPNDNPALKFWARVPDYMHQFDAPLPLIEKEKKARIARARAEQVSILEKPLTGEPLSGEELEDHEMQWGEFIAKLKEKQVATDPPPRDRSHSTTDDKPKPPGDAAC